MPRLRHPQLAHQAPVEDESQRLMSLPLASIANGHISAATCRDHALDVSPLESK